MEGNWVRKAFSSRWSELTYLWIDQFEASTYLPSNPLSNLPGHLNSWRVFCSNTPPGGGTFYTWPSFKTLTLQTFSSKTFAHQRELFFLNTSTLNVIICILLERLDTSGSNSPSPRSRMTVECPWVSWSDVAASDWSVHYQLCHVILTQRGILATDVVEMYRSQKRESLVRSWITKGQSSVYLPAESRVISKGECTFPSLIDIVKKDHDR